MICVILILYESDPWLRMRENPPGIFNGSPYKNKIKFIAWNVWGQEGRKENWDTRADKRALWSKDKEDIKY